MRATILLTPGFAADEHDHNCIPPLQALVRQTVALGVQVHVVALEYPFRSQPYDWYGATVWPCNGRNRRWLRWRTLGRAQKTVQHLLASTSGPTVLHSCWLGPAWDLGERCARRFGVRHTGTALGQDVLLSHNARRLRHLTPESAARVAVLSRFQQQKFFENTGLHAGPRIPWGVETPSVQVVDNQQLTINNPVVLGIGSLLPVKNWLRWLRVVRLAANARSDLRAVLIGDGPLRAALAGEITRLQLSGVVEMPGALPRPEVLARLQSAQALLHTADFESFGMVLAEAAAAGAAVVSTPVGIAPELGAATADTDAELAQLLLLALDGPRQPRVPFGEEATAQGYLGWWF